MSGLGDPSPYPSPSQRGSSSPEPERRGNSVLQVHPVLRLQGASLTRSLGKWRPQGWCSGLPAQLHMQPWESFVVVVG